MVVEERALRRLGAAAIYKLMQKYFYILIIGILVLAVPAKMSGLVWDFNLCHFLLLSRKT